MQLSESEWLELISDPVMAAEILLNITLPPAQAARLRLYWWVPTVHDDSSVGTGKTTLTFIWQALRHILLPHPVGYSNQLIALFYPTLSTAKEAIGDAFEKFMDMSPTFRKEVLPLRGGKYGLKSEEGYLEFRYRNGGITRMPAIGLTKDGQNLASRRYHHAICDEQKEMDLRSKVLDKQVLQRVNAPVPNKNHPLFTNHVKLLGHAEDPNTHPAYKRHVNTKRLIREGSQEYAIITSCYEDTPEEFAHLINPTEIRRDFIQLSREEFYQRRKGIWLGASGEWYSAKEIGACIDHTVQPLDRRANPHSIYVNGKDVAKGRNLTSDLNADCVLQATLLDPTNIRSMNGVYVDNFERPWRIEPVFGYQSRGQGAPELSGALHEVHNTFALNKIIIDPGGGGQWVLSETHKSKQIINGTERSDMIGLCEWAAQHIHPTSQPIIHTFTHGQLFLRHVMEEKFFRSAEGPIEGMHRLAQNMFAKRSICMMPCMDNIEGTYNFNRDAMQHWTSTQLQTAKFMDTVFTQLCAIEYEKDKTGTAKTTSAGFLKFSSTGKKDAAYAFLYALVGIISVLNDPELVE